MQKRVNALLAACLANLLQVALASASEDTPPLSSQDTPPVASEDTPPVEQRILQEGENRWVPSLSIIGGASFQRMDGRSASLIDEEPFGDPTVLREPASGKDLLVAPFVGAELQLMAPALPIPTRPRFFMSGEVLPTFASKRNLTVDGDPGCIKGPEVDAVCAEEELRQAMEEGVTRIPPGFRESAANGRGSKTTAEIDTLVFGANFGVSFPFDLVGRQIRFKPNVSWLNYKVNATGLVSEVNCNPAGRCTPTINFFGVVSPGNFREITLTGSDSQRFNGIGPGFDLEVDTGRFGPIGSSLFLGARFYRVLGDRTISFGDRQSYPELETPGFAPLPPAEAIASWEVEVDPWLYRAQVGFRLQWLGIQK